MEAVSGVIVAGARAVAWRAIFLLVEKQVFGAAE
jgi:hypothetical protein